MQAIYHTQLHNYGWKCTICSHFLTTPSSCPWPCGNQVPCCLLSLGHHCPTHHPAWPLTQADLTHCQSVLVGIIVVPRYPSSCPWPCGNQVPRRLLSLGHYCPAHYSAQPLTQADLTCYWSVLVGNVAVPCYPSVCPGHHRFCHCCTIIAPSVRTLLLMYTA